jgi:hypothetical protein
MANKILTSVKKSTEHSNVSRLSIWPLPKELHHFVLCSNQDAVAKIYSGTVLVYLIHMRPGSQEVKFEIPYVTHHAKLVFTREKADNPFWEVEFTDDPMWRSV